MATFVYVGDVTSGNFRHFQRAFPVGSRDGFRHGSGWTLPMISAVEIRRIFRIYKRKPNKLLDLSRLVCDPWIWVPYQFEGENLGGWSWTTLGLWGKTSGEIFWPKPSVGISFWRSPLRCESVVDLRRELQCESMALKSCLYLPPEFVFRFFFLVGVGGHLKNHWLSFWFPFKGFAPNHRTHISWVVSVPLSSFGLSDRPAVLGDRRLFPG